MHFKVGLLKASRDESFGVVQFPLLNMNVQVLRFGDFDEPVHPGASLGRVEITPWLYVPST